jgi:hypothetical protein
VEGAVAPSPKASDTPSAHPLCADCGAQTLGRYCHHCGNEAHVHRTLAHLGEELLHGVAHFDSRAWRTLPMLAFRPGRLTRGWIEGQRARYVSPLALFLFTVFVMFMALSYVPAPAERPVAQEARAAAARIQAQTGEARDGAIQIQSDGDWRAAMVRLAREGQLDTGDPKLDAKIRHKLENPDLTIYKLQQTFYKFSFLLVPISVPFVALLFLWKRGTTLYDHGVFVLYSLTFMSALVLLTALANRIGGPVSEAGATALALAVPTHMFFQLKGAYGLRWVSAAWRTVVLLIFCGVALGMFGLSILWLGMM